jgi:hypothetical protein
MGWLALQPRTLFEVGLRLGVLDPGVRVGTARAPYRDLFALLREDGRLRRLKAPLVLPRRAEAWEGVEAVPTVAREGEGEGGGEGEQGEAQLRCDCHEVPDRAGPCYSAACRGVHLWVYWRGEEGLGFKRSAKPAGRTQVAPPFPGIDKADVVFLRGKWPARGARGGQVGGPEEGGDET